MVTGKRIGAVVAAGTVALALSACGSTSENETASTLATQTPQASAAATAGGEFGPGCAAVPTDPSDPGSFAAMAQQPVATAASGNELLSTLVTAVQQADLVDTLDSAEELTVFAPTNDAFAKVPEADLTALLADTEQLTSVLTYHVVAGTIAPDQLAGTHETLQGEDLTITGSGEDFTVNDTAAIVCGNVQTANATVYIIDTVLMPQQ